MNNYKIELNQEAIREELLKSSWIQNECVEIAQGIADRAGDGYEVTAYVGKNRVNASVVATTKEAVKDNLDNNTLLKALGGTK